jgi:hypothetical protein
MFHKTIYGKCPGFRFIGNSRTESGQDGYGCITGWNNSLSSVENCYAVGSLTPDRGQKNPIIGIGDLTSLIVINNYSLNTLYEHDKGDVILTGIPLDAADMETQDFVDALNGPTEHPYVYVPGDYPALVWESQFVVLAGD